MSRTNIFWVGGTGSNVAMAFARMQHIGLINDRNNEIRHFFIDSPENFGASTEPDRFDKNIGVNEFKKLNIKSEATVMSITKGSYKDFASFLAAHPELRVLYEGLPDFDTIAGTPIKDGNYYRPAIAAAMASGELSYLKDKVRADRSILCGSSYGGTGAGVIPTLARYLIDAGQKVDVIYLNRWVIDKRKADVEKIILDNELANINYFKEISENSKKGRVANLRCYLFRVTSEWQQPAPSNKVNNTTSEIQNPYPYFISRTIDKLLLSAQGQMPPDEGSFEVIINTKNIRRNPAFIYSYAYSRIADISNNNHAIGFNYILELMSHRNPDWHLRRLLWDKTAFEAMRTLDFGDENAKASIHSKLLTLFHTNEGSHYFDWTGFVVKPIEIPPSNTIGAVSYPTAFASYFYFISQVDDNELYQNAYLALIALVARKLVYIDWDEYMDKLGYRREIGAHPLCIRNGKKDIIGYIAPKGTYVWPLPAHMEWLSGQLQLSDTVEPENKLRNVLYGLYEEERNNNDTFLYKNSVLRKVLDSWYSSNHPDKQYIKVWFNTSFFKNLKYENTNTHTYVRQIINHGNQNLTVQSDTGSETFSLEDNNLFVLSDKKVIIQYINMLSRGQADKIDRSESCKYKLILNYSTVYDLSKAGYEAEILHPAYIFTKGVVFKKSTTSSKDQQGIPVIPWPLRRAYVDCLEPENGWAINNDVCSPKMVNNDDTHLDMRPHKIRNWGKCGDIVPDDDSLFQIDKRIDLLNRSDIEYGCKIWPCDAVNNTFLSGWKFYTILVNSRYDRTGKRLGKKYEEWFYRVLSDSDAYEWKNISPVVDDDDDIRIVSWSGAPPVGISFEFEDNNLIYSGYFPLPAVNTMPLFDSHRPLRIGIDFGTSATCAAYMSSTHESAFEVQMNPSALIYTVFDSKPLYTENMDFAWVPTLGKDPSGIINTVLYSMRKSEYYKYIDIIRSDDSIEFVSTDPARSHEPFRDYTIPGYTLSSNHINDTNTCAHNIKWAGSTKEKMIYWKDFLTVYLLMLNAHFYMRGGYPDIKPSYNNFDIYATLPMKFLYEKKGIDIQGKNYNNLEEIFRVIFTAAAEDVSKITGLKSQFKDTVYESIAPIQGVASDKAIVVDVGGGTTDVSILNGRNCIATSSFVFAGNNPYRAIYKNESYGQFKDDGLQGDPDSIVHSFMYLICGYTALLAASAIYQTGLKQEIDQLEDINARASIFRQFKIYLFGRGWHLAKYDDELKGYHKEEKKRTYIDSIIKNNIVKYFNEAIIPSVFNKNFPELSDSNIVIADNPEKSKTQCAVGAISNENRAIIEARDDITFIGLSFRSKDNEVVEWYQHGTKYTIPDSSYCIIDAISPSLLIKEESYRSIIERFNDINKIEPFDHGSITRNFVEYVLEKRIGGYEGDERNINVTLNKEYIDKAKSKMKTPQGISLKKESPS